MPDLLGPNPCGKCACYHGAFCTNGNLIGVGECPRYAAYHARRELLEALKAGGVKFDNHGDPEGMSYDQFDAWLGQIHGPGHLIFIPEVQE